ncbi:MAG: putative MATE family efflux protein [Saprospiraceae bacterium]
MSNQDKKKAFGTEPLSRVLIGQAIPAGIGILIMSLYGIVDTIFVGRWVGSEGIGAITVAMPIAFLIASMGMAIGIGGSSIISRAFGDDDDDKANVTFTNMVLINIVLNFIIVVTCFIFRSELVTLFGAKGGLYEPTLEYFSIVLIGTPFLAWAMMCNNVIRSLGYPRLAMYTLVIPAILNTILDPVFIAVFDMGLAGAAWSTTISYVASFIYTLYFFVYKQDSLRILKQNLSGNWKIIKEIFSIGSVTFARQGTISALTVLLNNTLFTYGGEVAISAYGIISKVMMFVNVPALGITQGYVPILGYNYGAKLYDRVNKLTVLAMKYATSMALVLFAGVMIFTPQIVQIFTTDQELIDVTIPAIRYTFLATPLIAISLLGSAYFQAIGKPMPAMILALLKQGVFLIPLVILLPRIFDLNGIWWAFPMADVGAALFTLLYLYLKVVKK